MSHRGESCSIITDAFTVYIRRLSSKYIAMSSIDEESQCSPIKVKQVSSLDSQDHDHDAIVEAEPTHGCFTRFFIGILSLFSIGSVGYILTHYVLAPIEYVAFLSAKCTVCSFCCPTSIARTFRNVALSPIRWARIAMTGVGHIDCWTHPSWPFRPTAKPYTN